MSSGRSDDESTAPTRPERRSAGAGGDGGPRQEATQPLGEDTTPLAQPDDTAPATSDIAATDAFSAEIGGPLKLPERFEIRGRLGKGGMALVLRVHDGALGRDVAVKVLPHSLRWDETNRTRFEREARAAAMLRHPGLVTVHDIDAEGGFIVMELVQGESLRDRIKRDGAQATEEVRRIGASLLSALQAAHEAGVIHRDVKPSNVLISEDDQVKLADFGIASFGDSDLTTTGRHVGTPAYMPPEQLRGRNVDARADVYATGATLFEAATGRRLHDDERSERDPFSSVVEATGDAGLAAALATAVREEPEDRFPSAAAFSAALDDPAGARALLEAEKRVAGRSRARLLMGTVVVAAMVAAVTSYIVTRGGGPEAPPNTVAPNTAAPTPSVPSVALLPFEDRTGDPRLDFARAGLPHLMAMEMRRVPGARVVGYYRLLERVAGPDAPPADWIASAGALGAERVVRGVLSNGPHGVHVEVSLEQVDGTVLTRLARDVPAEGVPEAARRLATEIAALVIGRPVDLASPAARPLDLERSLHLGIAAVERHELVLAESELKAVLAENPDLGEARYYLALALWWKGAPSAETVNEVKAALATELTDAQRGFLQGMELFLDWRREEAVTHFRLLAETYPDNRDILYGLFEALFHSGRGADAVAVYRTVTELSPSFRLGLVHVLTHYTARLNEGGMTWALDRAAVLGEPPRDVWGAKMLIARKDVDAAIELLRRVSATTGSEAERTVARYATQELIRAYALAGEVELGLALAARIADESEPWPGETVTLRGLHTLRGDAAEAARWRERQTREATVHKPGYPRINAWLEVLLGEGIDPPAAHLEEIAAAVDSVPADAGWVRRMEFYQLGRAFLAADMEHWDELKALTDSSYPEVSAVARAFLAEHGGDLTAAAAAWREALASVGNGRFMHRELFELARVLRASGNAEATLAACHDALMPPLFDWGWAARAATLALWYGDAAAALGKREEARWGWERVLRWRAAAPADDPLVTDARAGLAGLGAD